jgi:hypothetical protein
MLARSLVRSVAVLSLVALGCHGSSSPSEPARQDALSLVSLSPAEGTVLAYGGTVDVTLRARYSFASANRGQIGLIAYPGSGGFPTGLPIFTDPFFFPVEGREGEVTLRFRVYFNLSDPPLPKGSRVTLDFALFPEGVNQSSTGFNAHYQLGS